MKILHYSLGFPPYRTGGLTKCSMDLMIKQAEEKNDVILLWPGTIKPIGNKTQIKYRGIINGIISYEVINPNPIPYDEGISNINAFLNNGDFLCYQKFLSMISPNIIHIHTLMGLHPNFLEAALEKNIRILFTAHDFFPICPKGILFKNRKICSNIANCEDCKDCNSTALSIKKIMLLQSALYRKVKNNKVISKLRKKHRDNYLTKTTIEITVKGKKDFQQYIKLRHFYENMLNKMSCIHYNSHLTQKIYRQYLNINCESDILPITHLNIQNHKKIKNINNKIRFTYMGPNSVAKGFFLLIEALDYIKEKNTYDFELHVYFTSEIKRNYLIEHERYTYSDLENIFEYTDMLIAPSCLYETFGYTVAEALSYGVPIIVSSTVGAKDLVDKHFGIVFESGNCNDLIKKLSILNINTISFMNREIVDKYIVFDSNNFSHALLERFYLKGV